MLQELDLLEEVEIRVHPENKSLLKILELKILTEASFLFALNCC